jgi:hypothetical protein
LQSLTIFRDATKAVLYSALTTMIGLLTTIPGYSEQDATDYFQSTDAYVRGTWTQLNVTEGTGRLRHTLTYTP